jgi:hypothetical protein
MAKSEYRKGTAGWWLLQLKWTEVQQRKGKNGRRPPPLWRWKGGAPVTLSKAIETEWARINAEFERKRECLNQKTDCEPSRV